jgi:hypothetical protein
MANYGVNTPSVNQYIGHHVRPVRRVLKKTELTYEANYSS